MNPQQSPSFTLHEFGIIVNSFQKQFQLNSSLHIVNDRPVAIHLYFESSKKPKTFKDVMPPYSPWTIMKSSEDSYDNAMPNLHQIIIK